MSKLLVPFDKKVYYPFLVSDACVFSATYFTIVNNKLQLGAVYMVIINVKKYSITFKFSNVTFKNKDTSNSSSCIFAASYPPMENKIHFVMNSVKAYHNEIPNQIFAELTISPFSHFFIRH